ncbi:MAG: transporter [Candidatus Methylomirabilales bacterium]
MIRQAGVVFAAMLILVGVLSTPAEALRPFRRASDAGVVDPGTVEVEIGIDVSRNTRGNSDETSYAVPSAVFNIGIVDRFEIDIVTGFDVVEDDQTDTTLGSAADTLIVFKTLWREGEEGSPTPALATEFSLNLPTARDEFQPDGRHRVGGTGQVDLTGEVGPLLYILNLGGGVEPSPEDADYVGVFIWAVAGELTVADGVAVVSEFQGKAIPGADDETTALLGLTYTTPGGVKFDFAGFAGLTDGSDNWGITFGLTFDFAVLSGTSGKER